MLEQFLNPKAIAVIGASENKQKVGGVLIEKLLKFKGKVIPINPNHTELFGLKCYKSVLDYNGKEKIELALIAIPKDLVAASLEECGRKGIKNVIIISAGFAEAGDTKSEKELTDIAERYKIKMLGPNCFGVCNPAVNLDCTFSALTPRRGEIAFISQSGALWSYIADFASDKFGFSGFVSLGNMADIGFNESLEYFIGDKKTKNIVIYVEKLKDGRKFIDICRKQKKNIYAVKAGISKEGSKAAISHTGSLATDYEVYKGAFKQAGVQLCESLEEAFEKASGEKLVERKIEKLDIGKKIIIVTNAGGAGALAADYCSLAGKEILEGPIDLIGTATAESYKNFFMEISGEKAYDSVIVILTPQKMTDVEKVAAEVLSFSRKTKKKIIACFLGEKTIRKARKILEDNGIKCFNTLEEFRLAVK